MRKIISVCIILFFTAVVWSSAEEVIYIDGVGGVAAGGGCTSNSGDIIVGQNSTANDRTYSDDIIYFAGPYQATDDCEISELTALFNDYTCDSPPCYVRMGVYNDNGSQTAPTGSAIRSGAETTVDAATEVSSITTWTPTEGSYYWLAVVVSGAGLRGNYNTNAANYFYQSWTYHSTNDFPDVSGAESWSYEFTLYGDVD